MKRYGLVVIGGGAGGLTGGPPFTHVAACHGRLGLTEQQARARWGDDARAATFDDRHGDRAVCGTRRFARPIVTLLRCLHRPR